MFDTVTHPKKRTFLVAYSQCPNVTESAALADISRELHYDWLQKDPAYAEAFECAKSMAGDALEDELHRRATKGSSDKLLLAMLGRFKPDQYGTKRVKNEHTGPGGGPLQVIDWSQFSTEELKQLERFAARRIARPVRDPGGDRAPQAEQVLLAVPGDGPAAA